MKHTQGNWRAIKMPQKVGHADYQVAWSEDDELVCDVVYTEADACLIAAAPDLLASVRELEIELRQQLGHIGKRYNSPENGIGVVEEIGLMLNRARYAIAKATGRITE